MIALADATLEATFAPEAGMLGAALRDRGEDLLSPLGIPLLHPWANRLSAPGYLAAGRRGRVPRASFIPRDEKGLAIHGVTQPPSAWSVEEQAPNRLRARLLYPGDAERHEAFPYPHRLEVDAELFACELRVRTTLTPTADVAVPVAFGYHPYLQLPGVARRAWHVTLPVMRRLDLDHDQLPTGGSRMQPAWAGRLNGQCWDDAFTDVPDGAAFVLEGGGRRITVRFDDGFGVAQLFAPRAADVVCFEPMTAPVDALVTGHGLRVVPPGGRHSATFSIRVEDAGVTAPRRS
jgi:galactose mutarotase-like enzyme